MRRSCSRFTRDEQRGRGRGGRGVPRRAGLGAPSRRSRIRFGAVGAVVVVAVGSLGGSGRDGGRRRDDAPRVHARDLDGEQRLARARERAKDHALAPRLVLLQQRGLRSRHQAEQRRSASREALGARGATRELVPRRGRDGAGAQRRGPFVWRAVLRACRLGLRRRRLEEKESRAMRLLTRATAGDLLAGSAPSNAPPTSTCGAFLHGRSNRFGFSGEIPVDLGCTAVVYRTSDTQPFVSDLRAIHHDRHLYRRFRLHRLELPSLRLRGYWLVGKLRKTTFFLFAPKNQQ